MGSAYKSKNDRNMDTKDTSYLPMIGGSLRVLWLLPPQKLFAMI
jgi:hypothetical protein